MDRRGFIGKALAGIAAIPFLGKLVNSQQPWISNVKVERSAKYRGHFAEPEVPFPQPKYYAALIEHSEDGLKEVSAKGYQRMPIQEIGEPLHFPMAEEDWGYVTHFAVAKSPTGPISRLFDIHKVRL
jgi:hypothetical protein